jgi:hypothetical protein
LTFIPANAFGRGRLSPLIRLAPCLIALFLAFPSPGPAFDSGDDEAVVETVRSSRNDRQAEQSKRRRADDPETIPAGDRILRCFDGPNRFRPADDWTPRLFSRPPPSV